jgi:CRP-like cAMP-binding protein
MPTGPPTLLPMVKKLELWMNLDAEDQDAVMALPHSIRRLSAGEFIIRDGDEPTHSCLLLRGFAYRHKLTGEGARQIMSIHMKGDVVDLQNAFFRQSDHNVEALTNIDVALIPIKAISELAFDRPTVGKAMWCETLVDASIFREWTLNVGRRQARERMAHLLCEFAMRLDVAGLGAQLDYELPMTQDQLADALGLTSVHVNRTLMALQTEGLIVRTRRSVRIPDWKALASVADFDPRYLHLQPELPRSIERPVETLQA